MTRSGYVAAICTSPNGGVPKYAQDIVELGLHGLAGDYHNRAMRPGHGRLGVLMPNNNRHLTIVAREVYEFLNAELGTTLAAGSFGENILVEDMGDLGDVPPDARVTTCCGRVVLRVTAQNEPCVNLQTYHRLMAKMAYGQRGLLCAIERGRGEHLSRGLPITISW